MAIYDITPRTGVTGSGVRQRLRRDSRFWIGLATLGIIVLIALLARFIAPYDPNAQLDSNVAASMISGYRQNNGLSAVSVDPQLSRAAREQAEAMARRNKLDHDVAGALGKRVKSTGFDAALAVENTVVPGIGL